MEANQPVPDVIVSEFAAAKLANHLHQQGRLQGGVPMVIASLNKAVDRKWGVAADHFTDAAGPGWIIDVSDYFEDELLYAIVRSEMGNRSVVAVVDEDEVGAFKKTGQWTTAEARAGGLSEVVGEPAPVPEGDPAPNVHALPTVRQFQAAGTPKPDDPRLVVWWDPGADIEEQDDDGRVGTKAPNAIHCTYGEAQAEVMRLLMRGCKVEVWSGVKHPELKVDL